VSGRFSQFSLTFGLLNPAASLNLSARLNNMNSSGLDIFLAMGPAPAPPGTQADPRAQTFGLVGWMAILVVIMYLVMFRPQQKKAKEQAAMLKSIKAGDKIVTSSGIVAVVVTVKEHTLSVRSADSKFEITKSSVAQVTERGGEASQS
jgi:preprotein translocase subunit YajC